MLVASYTKSGGSWLVWMLIEMIHKPPFFCDLVDKSVLDEFVKKTEYPLNLGLNNPDIHVFRHPLDVVCSAWNYSNLVKEKNDHLLLKDSKPITETEYYDHFLEEGALYNFIPRIQYMDTFVYGLNAPVQIAYEDMLQDTSRELTKITSKYPQAELKNIPAAIDKYSLQNCKSREHEAVNKLKRITNPGYSFFFKAKKYYYKEKLTTQQIKKGHDVFSDVIKEYWPDSQ